MQAKGRAKKSEVIKLSKETVKGIIDAEWLAVEVAGLIYNSGKANIFNILESIYEDEYDPRLRANKKLAENIISGIGKRASELIRDALGDWKVEVEVGGEVSPGDAAEAKREYNEARNVIGLPPIMDTDEVAAYIANETGIDVDLVGSVLSAETAWMQENGFIDNSITERVITIEPVDEICGKEVVFNVDAVCPYCTEQFKSMVVLYEDEKKGGLKIQNFTTETCPCCEKEMKTSLYYANLSIKLEMEKLQD